MKYWRVMADPQQNAEKQNAEKNTEKSEKLEKLYLFTPTFALVRFSTANKRNELRMTYIYELS